MPSTYLRLTVWKPLVLERSAARASFDNGNVTWPLLQSGDLYIEAYSWRPVEDLLSSVQGDDVQRVRAALHDRFSPFKSPEERAVGLLSDTIAVFGQLLAEGNTSWRECLQPVPMEGEEDEICYRVNSVRAFYLQLRWIYQVFHAVPAANVTVR